MSVRDPAVRNVTLLAICQALAWVKPASNQSLTWGDIATPKGPQARPDHATACPSPFNYGGATPQCKRPAALR